MALVLYELAGSDPDLRFSPHCWKVRMALAHKGLNADRQPWRFTEKEAIAFSGQGKVPVLVDSDETVTDSWRIAEYLDMRFPETSALFPGTGVAELAHFVNAWTDTTLLPLTVRIILLDIYDCLDAKDRDYFRRSREERFGKSLEAVAADGAPNIAALQTALTPLRQILKKRPYLSGDAPAYADYCIFGLFMWVRCSSPVRLLEPDDPIFLWRDRLLDAFGGLARSATCRETEGPTS